MPVQLLLGIVPALLGIVPAVGDARSHGGGVVGHGVGPVLPVRHVDGGGGLGGFAVRVLVEDPPRHFRGRGRGAHNQDLAARALGGVRDGLGDHGVFGLLLRLVDALFQALPGFGDDRQKFVI